MTKLNLPLYVMDFIEIKKAVDNDTGKEYYGVYYRETGVMAFGTSAIHEAIEASIDLYRQTERALKRLDSFNGSNGAAETKVIH